MKKTNAFYIPLFAGVLIALIINSCAPAYVPNVINTPMFSNKGEGQVVVNAGLSGFDPQLSYAITDHFGAMLNGSFANRTSDSTDDFHKHQFVELGSGYFTSLGTSGRFEVYGGAGFGKLQANYENELWQSRTNVKSLRFFLQPAIGATTDIFDGSIAARFVVLNLNQESVSNTGFFLEPAITAKVGYKYAKAVFQFGLSLPLNKENIHFDYQPFLFSVGLQATLGKKYEE